MKKLFFISSSLFLMAVFFISCAQKDKLTASSMILKIDAPGYSYENSKLTMSANSTISVRAVIKNARGKDIDKSVIWSIADSSLASFSSTNSKETELTSNGTSGSTDITLTCEGLQVKATLQIS